MSENIFKRICSNPFLLVVFLFPVIIVIISTCVGFYFGTHQFDLGVISNHLYGKPDIVRAIYPDTNFRFGPVGSYRQAKIYDIVNGEIVEVPFFDHDSTNDLNTLSAIIEKNVLGERKQVLLKQINSFRILSEIEHRINKIRLDWVPVLIGLLIFTALFYNFGRRLVIILIWYTLCYFLAVFGYFAHWLLPFRQPHTPYLFGFYDEYAYAFSERLFATTLLIEVFIIIPGLYFLKVIILKVFPKVVWGFKKIRDLNKF